MQTTCKQLRHETGAVLRAVERGETVIVTYRGRPVAEMTALEEGTANADDELFGIWKGNKTVASVDDFLTKVRKGRVG